jgi:hypothetical protein
VQFFVALKKLDGDKPVKSEWLRAAPLELPYASSGDGKISSLVLISSIVSHDGLEIAVAFPTVPNMMDLPLISILGPFGCNQLIPALSALHPEVGTAMGCYRHRNLSAFASKRWREKVTE